MRTVIFDLDGTLADTCGRPPRRRQRVFRGLGLGDLLGPDDAGTALRGGRAMLTLGFERAEGCEGRATWPQQLPEAPRSATRRRICVETALYPGRRRGGGAAARGAATGPGICTNKPERLAEILMDRLGARHLFDSLVGADTLPVRKPDPEPLREAARRAGGDPGARLPRGRQRHRPGHRARGRGGPRSSSPSAPRARRWPRSSPRC